MRSADSYRGNRRNLYRYHGRLQRKAGVVGWSAGPHYATTPNAAKRGKVTVIHSSFQAGAA